MDYASRDSSDSKRTYAPVDQSTKPLGTSNGDVSKINRNSSHDLAVIGVRLLDDAHMTWVAAEFESEHALRAWFDAGAARCGRVDRIPRGGRPRGRGGP